MIYYLNSYVDSVKEPNRELTVAANSKIQYILDAIAGFHDVVSISQAKSTSGRLRKKEYESGRIKYVYMQSPSANLRARNIVFKWYCTKYLLSNVKNGDTIIVYHSLFWIRILKLLKKVKKIKLILELNDFYRFHFEGEKAEKVKMIEEEFFLLPDAFILANPDMMTELKNIVCRKKWIVNYGAYRVVENIGYRDNGNIKVIYSGVAERLRGAAYLAASTAPLLPKQYELHMACYGTTKNIDELKSMIEINNKKALGANIIYHGTLDMGPLTDLMSECDIALSCHAYSDEEKYKAMFSYPSKIPLNMGTGLYMVSPSIPTFLGEPFNRATFYFDEFTPESISDAIQRAGQEICKEDSKSIPISVIKELDEQFREDIERLIFE